MKKYIFLLPFTILIITSCSKKNTVKLIEKNFKEEITINSNLKFTFDKNLIPDSLLNKWIAEDYCKITPPVDGRYLWAYSNELTFSPANGFQPATEYTIELTKKITKHSKEIDDIKSESVSFHTPLLQLNNVIAYWNSDKKSSSDFYLQIDMDFNYNVNPREINDKLKIKIDKNEKTCKLKSEEQNNSVSFIIDDLKPEDKDYEAEIILEKGLIPVNGSIGVEKEITEEILISSPYKLVVIDVNTEHDGIKGRIIITTSQQAEQTNIRKFISISPYVGYTVTTHDKYITIESNDFDTRQKYEITLKKNMKGILGGTLKNEYKQDLSFGELQPSIKFLNNKEVYLSAKGSKNIEVAIVNIPKMKVKITKIYENNILKFLNENYSVFSNYNDYYDDYYYDDYYYYSGRYSNINYLGDIIYEEEINTLELPRYGGSRLFNLDFNDKFPDYDGLYVVEMNSTEDYWLRASKVIVLSDIGIIAKQGENTTVVFTNSIRTAEPLANVECTFIGRNNQILGTSVTDGQGVAVFENKNFDAPGFQTSIISARLDKDYNFIPLEKTGVSTSRFDVGGKWKNDAGLEAFIYGDRELYRPGETVYLSAIIRDYQWINPGELPVILKFINPEGKELTTIKKTLNKHGSFETEISTNQSWMTGNYYARLYTSNDVFLASKNIKLEEFVPDRIRVKAGLNKEEFKPGETVELDLQAMNFFGPPASNRNYEVEMSIEKKYFSPKENNDFYYSLQENDVQFSNVIRTNTTDSEGKVHENFTIRKELKNMGVLRSDFYITVFDETGRPVSTAKTADIYTQNVFYGMKHVGYYNSTGSIVKIPVIAVDKHGKALENTSAKITLIKHDYKTVLTKSGSYFRYRSEKVERVLEEKTITLNGKINFYTFKPEQTGKYEIRLTKPGVNTYVNQTIWAYGWGTTTSSSVKVNNEGQIDIEPDKDKYNPGEKAHVIVKTPFSGKVLITVENENVIDHFYIETDNRVGTFDYTIREEHVPNIYISATLFKAHKKSDLPLTVAHGIAPLTVDNPVNKMPVEIIAAKDSRSGKKQTVKVRTKPNSAVTIAVVDEGVLQITNYKTPDPYGFFYGKRALAVKSSDIYPFLFPELETSLSASGGGMDELSDKAKRLNPLTSKRIEIVSEWSKILKTNSKGEASYEINIPQFSGSLRIMAVGYNGKAFGSGESNIRVADPVTISTALPRFFSPKDTVFMPVMITNTTKEKASCNARIKVDGPLSVISSTSKNVKIDANSEKEILFKLAVKPEMGEANIIVTIDALGEKFTNSTKVPVRPASPLQKTSDAGIIKGGQSSTISLNTSSYLPASVDCKLMIAKTPAIEFTNDLSYLIRYPYGCVEQTVSAAFPQLYLSDLSSEILKASGDNANPNYHIQEAIKKLELMQLYNGGLTYWPGSGNETWWGTVYGAHFLLEAKKAGYEVNDEVLKKMYKYLIVRLKEKKLINYYYNINKNRKIVPKEVPYSLYVLALAGKKQVSTMNYYKSHQEQLSLDGKYLLAASYAIIGDMEKYRQITPSEFKGEISVNSFGGSFYSYIRDKAISLNALIEADPDDPRIAYMAKHLSQDLKTRRYLNTQERAFSLLALGKIAKRAKETNISATITADGKTIGDFTGQTITLNTKQIKGKKITITTKGNGILYYFWEAEGISADGSYRQEDSFIKVRRRFYDRNGNLISGNQFRQNDLILVELALDNLKSGSIENIAISDILPAGFEIENPRLTTLPSGMDYPHNRSYPDYQDIRDDRINLFDDLYLNTRYYYYLVRAVSPGTFQMGPVGADAMYNGEFHSYHGGGTIVITR